MYSEGRLTRSRARSQGVGNFEELPLTSSKFRTTLRKAPGRPAFLDVTAETENSLISEESTSSIKNLSAELEPTQVLPGADHGASSLGGTNTDVSAEGAKGGPTQASLPETSQHSVAVTSQEGSGADNKSADQHHFRMPAGQSLVQTEGYEDLADTDKNSSQGHTPDQQEHAPAGDLICGSEALLDMQELPAEESKEGLVNTAFEAAAKSEDTGNMVIGVLPADASVTADHGQEDNLPATYTPSPAPELAETPGPPDSMAAPEVPATVVAKQPDAGHITADSLAPKPIRSTPSGPAGSLATASVSSHLEAAVASAAKAPATLPALPATASPAAAMAYSPALTVPASPTVTAVPSVPPARTPIPSSALSAAASPAAAMAYSPAVTVAAATPVAAVPPAASSAVAMAYSPAVTAASTAAVAAGPSAASPVAAMAYSPAVTLAGSPTKAALPSAATAAAASDSADMATLPSQPPAASPAMTMASSPAVVASNVRVDEPKTATPAASGVLAAVYLNDTDSESGDTEFLQSGVSSKLRNTPGRPLAAAYQASPHFTGVVDSVYDDESDADSETVMSPPGSTRRAALPDVKAAEVQQHSLAGAASMRTADEVKNAADAFDRWEMDTGMETSEDNMHLGHEPTSRLGSQVHASLSYDPRSLRQLRKDVANKLAQQAAARAQAEAEAAPLPRTPAGLCDSQSDADMSPSPYQQAPKEHTEEDEKLCNALGSLDIQSASKSRQPLRGLPVPQGVHIRFDDEGQARPSPSATQTKLRGVPAPRNSHIRFD